MFPTCSLRDAFDFCLYSSQAPISRDCKVHIFFSFFFWLERLAKPTDKVTRSHQERGFQSSEQTCSALQTPYKTTWVLELIHPTDPRSCHPINTPRVALIRQLSVGFLFIFLGLWWWMMCSGTSGLIIRSWWCFLTPTRLNFMGHLGHLPRQGWAEALCSWKDYCSPITKIT